jgi:hypothetical protein
MKKVVLILLIGLSLLYNQIYAQINLDVKIDTLNNYNEKGEKHGGWIEYLSKQLAPTNNKKKASYYGICFYENEKRIIPSYGKITGKHQIITDGNKYMGGNPVLLNGNYYKIQRQDTIEHYMYEQGYLRLVKSYFKNKKIHYSFDYQKKYKGNIHSYYLIEYGLDGNIISKGYYLRKNGRWHFQNEVNNLR